MNINFHKGQALLVGLLVIFSTSIALAVAGAVVASSQVVINKNQKLSAAAYNSASSCLENTLMRMIKNQITPPTQLSINDGNCTISITTLSPGTYQILSVAEITTVFGGKVTKKIQSNVTLSGFNVLTVSSQGEID